MMFCLLVSENSDVLVVCFAQLIRTFLFFVGQWYSFWYFRITRVFFLTQLTCSVGYLVGVVVLYVCKLLIGFSGVKNASAAIFSQLLFQCLHYYCTCSILNYDHLFYIQFSELEYGRRACFLT